MSYKLGGLLGDEDKVERTGSIKPAAVKEKVTEMPAADLAYAKAAASEALLRDGTDVSVPWENPATGARGAVTPLAAAYTQEGFTCRDFLASHVRDGSEAWLQGEACRLHRGQWEVRQLRPLQRS
jgi:surface antigen